MFTQTTKNNIAQNFRTLRPLGPLFFNTWVKKSVVVAVLILDLGLSHIVGVKRKRIFCPAFVFLRAMSNVIWKKNSRKSRAAFTKFAKAVTGNVL